MSRNNLIIVAHIKNHMRYYVFLNMNADTQWDKDFILKLINNNTGHFYLDRGQALIFAHDQQLKLDTEYGVQEMFI